MLPIFVSNTASVKNVTSQQASNDLTSHITVTSIYMLLLLLMSASLKGKGAAPGEGGSREGGRRRTGWWIGNRPIHSVASTGRGWRE